ncbi:terminase gpP N-terminus-related DNA-binding protein [Pseudonocardia aurantiaca]|uniref:Terminase ATPase subunit N-terminal domain-containing protein n=1 Tax=Pseudonocardia aurantiaca TaxID=75290 RepID=A0ABW4FSA2_9PSEU
MKPGWPAARIAEPLGIAQVTVHKWVRRSRSGTLTERR